MLNIIIPGLTALVASVLAAPVTIRKLKSMHVGQKILEDGPTWHAKKENTPTMGGVIFIFAVFVGMAAQLPSMMITRDLRPLLMLALSFVFGAVGFADDITKIKHKENKGLSAAQKLLLQIAAAALFVTVMRISGYLEPSLYVPFFKVTLNTPWLLYLAIAVFIIVGTDNAVNLTDGIDGLCTSVTAVCALFFSVMLGMADHPGAGFASTLFGALLGFFMFNKNPAKVFMGDTGSLFLGGAVCAMAFMYGVPLIILPVGIIFFTETLSVILQVAYFKLTHGKRLFKMSPLHHHLEKCGWSEWKIVIVFTLITCAACVLSALFA
ncbi:MAG: phospho-N-acetylmuramoyl-pentapeptide-transferase [Clostridia bacterium]|nr:phospho-N-acetylmuramoyl-pentapeptide-transferase [Clostridia bacterium]